MSSITDRVPARHTSTWASAAAGAWSLGYAPTGLYWALGGAGFPYRPSERAANMGAVLVAANPAVAGTVICGLGLTGVAVAAAMTTKYGGRRRILRWTAWAMAAWLLLVVPDGRLLLGIGEIFVLNFDRFEGAAFNQAVCALGGALWTVAAVRARRSSQETGQMKRGSGHEVSGAGWSWDSTVAYAAVALPLFYAAPRFLWAMGLTFGLDQETAASVISAEGRAREIVFAAVTCGGALLTTGLIRRWGEAVPRWVPLLGGRRIPVPLATMPAGAVSVVLIGAGFTVWRTLLAAWLGAAPGAEAAFDMSNWAAWLGNLAWLPWGLALASTTLTYRRRRRNHRVVTAAVADGQRVLVDAALAGSRASAVSRRAAEYGAKRPLTPSGVHPPR